MVLQQDKMKDLQKKIKEEAIQTFGAFMILRIKLLFQISIQMPEEVKNFDSDLGTNLVRKTKRITKISMVRQTAN